MKKITKESTLKEILEIKNIESILKKYNFPCLKCPFASLEAENLKLKEIARLYGIDIESLIKEVNSYLKNEK